MNINKTTPITMIPYGDLCVADGCDQRAKGYSKFCAKHSHREQAHGHEMQTPISRTQLKEPMARLARWYKTPEGKTAIDAAVSHYVMMAEKRVTEHSTNLTEIMRTGIKWSSPYNQATQFIAEVYGSKDPHQTVMEQLALGLLVEESPGMFKNDTAFLFTTTHQFMRRSAAKQKFRFRSTHGRAIAATRYLSRKTRQELGRWLTREIVYFGVLIYRQWTKGAAEEKRQRAKVTAAITGQPVSA